VGLSSGYKRIGQQARKLLGTFAGFAAGGLAIWIGVLGFDIAFVLGFTRHGSEVTTGVILVAAAVFAIASWVVSVYFGKFIAWLSGVLACLVAMYFGLWSLTGAATQALL
jgi:hypothetical protein